MSPEAKKLGDKPALPVETNTIIYTGMTMRQAFAKAAMQGFAANQAYIVSAGERTKGDPVLFSKVLAQQSVFLADALLEEMAKESK
jgi:ABC-type hemin transport system ATPase subunit